jgi:hypothetical protein
MAGRPTSSSCHNGKQILVVALGLVLVREVFCNQRCRKRGQGDSNHRRRGRRYVRFAPRKDDELAHYYHFEEITHLKRLVVDSTAEMGILSLAQSFRLIPRQSIR